MKFVKQVICVWTTLATRDVTTEYILNVLMVITVIMLSQIEVILDVVSGTLRTLIGGNGTATTMSVFALAVQKDLFS